MKTRPIALSIAACLVALVCASSAGAAMVTLYRNAMDTSTDRAQMLKVSGRSCKRGATGGALKIEVGKRTASCSYRTPVLGRDLEIGASERISSETTAKLQKQAFLGLELRAGGGAKYQFLVYPLQKKAQLVKVTKEGSEFLAIEKNVTVLQGLDKANNLRFRVLKSGSAEASLVGYVGATRVLTATDETAGEISGRFSGIVVGSTKNAVGLIASADDVAVRIPSPY